VIVRQIPPAGSTVKRGDVVVLTVSSGPEVERETPVLADVPDVVGTSASNAVVVVHDAGLVPKIVLVTSADRAWGVIRQRPTEGAEVARGSTVRLFVARSRPEVPSVIGLGVAEARRELRTLGFGVEVVRTRSSKPAGTVVRQTPRPGTSLAKGGRVTLTVSTGAPTELDVPDVVGLDEQSACAELGAAGFEVHVTYEPTDDPAQDGVVVDQTPLGNDVAEAGSVVTLVVARLT
jgi:serine/threonine-protein kinase